MHMQKISNYTTFHTLIQAIFLNIWGKKFSWPDWGLSEKKKKNVWC